MPRVPINYDETCIYKLISKDPDITETYIGHTTNMIKRKQGHKYSCNDINGDRYHLNVYEYIRANGGWDNFNMILLERFSCKDQYEASAKEQEYITKLHSTLNSRSASRTDKEYREQNRDTIREKANLFYEKNKEILNKQKRNNRQQNKVLVNEKDKQYYELNKVVITKNQKIYYEQNKDEISEKRKETIVCECGSVCRKDSISRHIKTKYHQQFIESQKKLKRQADKLFIELLLKQQLVF